MEKRKAWYSPNKLRSDIFARKEGLEVNEDLEHNNNYKRVKTPMNTEKTRTSRRLTSYNDRGEQGHELPDDNKMAIRRIAQPLNITNKDTKSQQEDN